MIGILVTFIATGMFIIGLLLLVKSDKLGIEVAFLISVGVVFLVLFIYGILIGEFVPDF